MINLRSRRSRLTLGLSALTVGAAIALPATALAADPPPAVFKVNQAELTANGDSTSTDIAMKLPAGQVICGGPIVVVGTHTDIDLYSTPPTIVFQPIPGSPSGIGTPEAAQSPVGQALGITSPTLTVPASLGNGEFTALMQCKTMAELEADDGGSGTYYLRHIKDGQGVGGNNSSSILGSLGSLDFGGSLETLLGGLAIGG